MSELREAGIRCRSSRPAGIRNFDDCREFFWAGADAVSLGSAVWLKPIPLYALGPIEGLRIRRMIAQVEGYQVPERQAQPIDFAPRPIEAEPYEALDQSAAEERDESELVGVGPR